MDAALLRLDQGTPPFDTLPEHQRLSQALEDAVAGQDLAQVRQALDEAELALADLEQKGYDVRAPG